MSSEKTPRLKELFRQLWAEKQKIVAELAPARAIHDELVNDPRLVAARKTIKELSAKLAPIDNELAGLARALGSKRMKLDPGVFSAVAPE